MKLLTRFDSLFFTTAFCLFLVSPCLLGGVNSATATENYPDRLELLAMAKNGQIAELDALLSGYQENFEAGKISERVVNFAFWSFSNSDPALAPRFDAWIKQMPNSYSALLARGLYRRNLGTTSRGTRSVRNTAESRFRKMRLYLDLATSDLIRAIEINNKLGTAYAALINIHMFNGARNAKETTLEAGLRAVPDSFIIRRLYLFSLVPWWGGSLVEIRSFIDEMKRHSPRDGTLKVLEGYYDFTVAEQLRRGGKGREALEYYDRALSYGELGWYRLGLGWNYFKLKQYQKALENVNRALMVRPQDAFFLNKRAILLRKLGRYDEAFRDWELAVKLDPLDPDILLQVAYALRDRKFYDQALAALNNALHYGADDHYIRDARGRLYLYELNDPVKAVEDLRVATQLSPGSTRYLYNYAVALYKSRDCEAVKAIRNFRKTCRKGMPSCRSKNLTWARNAIKYLTTTVGCAR